MQITGFVNNSLNTDLDGPAHNRTVPRFNCHCDKYGMKTVLSLTSVFPVDGACGYYKTGDGILLLLAQDFAINMHEPPMRVSTRTCETKLGNKMPVTYMSPVEGRGRWVLLERAATIQGRQQ